MSLTGEPRASAPAPGEPLAQTGMVRLTDGEVEALSWREIARAGRRIARLRIVFLPVMVALAACLTYLEPAPWRIWILAIVGALGATLVVRDFFWLRDRSIELRQVPYFLSVIIAVQASLIAITGGVESPFLVILVVMAVLPALVLGSLRLFVVFLLIPLSVVWFFTLGSLTGLLPSLLPGYFGPGVAFATNGVYTVTQATIMTFAMSLGGLVGVFLRLAIRRGSRAVADARQELLWASAQQNQELVALTGEIAHELKNPLASIQGLSGLIAKKLQPGTKEAEQMQVLLAEVRRMGTTLDELLSFSRPVTRLASARVHPASLLGEVALLHEGLALKHGVSLRVEPGDALPVSCDPRKVKQVLTNLVQNALTATPAGGSITLRTAHGSGSSAHGAGGTAHGTGSTAHGAGSSAHGAGSSARILVEDTGSGLAPEVRGRLFTPGVSTKPEGSGIGLVIARAIAEQHGGSLTLMDRPGGGCVGELTLPLDPPALDEAHGETRGLGKADAKTSHSESRDPKTRETSPDKEVPS